VATNTLLPLSLVCLSAPQMNNHVSCLQSRANQLLREQGAVQQHLDVLEGLLHARDAWAAVVKSVLQPSWECNELLQLAQTADQELQSLHSGQPKDSERILQHMPLLPALSRIDR